MIVECIVDISDQPWLPDWFPKKSESYEVVGFEEQYCTCGRCNPSVRVFYILREDPSSQSIIPIGWDSKLFREVEINIDEIKEIIEVEEIHV